MWFKKISTEHYSAADEKTFIVINDFYDISHIVDYPMSMFFTFFP